jgi:hypothetical protein
VVNDTHRLWSAIGGLAVRISILEEKYAHAELYVGKLPPLEGKRHDDVLNLSSKSHHLLGLAKETEILESRTSRLEHHIDALNHLSKRRLQQYQCSDCSCRCRCTGLDRRRPENLAHHDQLANGDSSRFDVLGEAVRKNSCGKSDLRFISLPLR